MAIEGLSTSAAGDILDRRFNAWFMSSKGWTRCSVWLSMRARLNQRVTDEIMQALGVAALKPEVTVTIPEFELEIVGLKPKKLVNAELTFSGKVVQRRGHVIWFMAEQVRASTDTFQKLKDPLYSFVRLRE